MSQANVKTIVRYLSKRENALGFARVADPRACRGRRWSLRSLLTATFISMVAQEHSLRGVERLTRDLSGCRRRLGIPRRVPDSTLAHLIARLDDEAGLRQVLVEDVKRAHRRKALQPVGVPIGVVAIDGKTIWCGTASVNDPACQAMPQTERTYNRLHALHAVLVSASSQPCIDQMLVPAETNEMGALPAFVEQLVAGYGRTSLVEVVSMDAGMTSMENARQVTACELRYVMAVKGTQPTLLAEIVRQCGGGAHKQVGHVCAAVTPWERYRGKRIRRELFRSADICGWPGWESAHQVWRVKQTTEHRDGTTEVENRFFITSLPWDRLTGQEILRLVRLHWGVENGCHWTMDVVLGEDAHPWCTRGRALRMLSWLRLLAYNALRLLRDRYLRSSHNHTMPWDELRRWVRRALEHSTAWQVDTLAEATAATL
jgi:predicted transposase YbfD/YdcC